MKIITKRDQIKGIIKSFRDAYGESLDKPSWVHGKTRGDLLQELKTLNLDHATDKEIYNILDRDWVSLRCNECGLWGGKVIQLGEEPDYESNTVWVCIDCIKKALKILTSQ